MKYELRIMKYGKCETRIYLQLVFHMVKRVKGWKSKRVEENNKGYHKLIIYQKAKQLVILTYQLTKDFPSEEKYSLVSQMRRAAISVLANIVEGYSRHTRKDFARFIDISIGSITELGLYLELSLDLKYGKVALLKEATSLLIEIKKMLYAFQNSLRKGGNVNA